SIARRRWRRLTSVSLGLMKAGCLWAFVTWLATLVSLISVAPAVSAIWRVRLNPEGFGDLSSRIGLFLGFVVFIVVWIRQANRKERQPKTPPKPAPVTPENLQPIDYSKLPSLYNEDPKP